MFEYGLTMKSGELFIAGVSRTDGSRESPAGLYFRDTRYLSRLDVSLAGQSLELLSLQASHLDRAMVYLANPRHDLVVVLDIELSDRLSLAVTVQNYGRKPLSDALVFAIDADFRDLFDLRGFARVRPGERLPTERGDGWIRMAYRGVDGAESASEIVPDDTGGVVAIADSGGVSIAYRIELDAGDALRRGVTVQPIAPSGDAETGAGAAYAPASVRTGHALLDAVHEQSERDLAALDTPFPAGIMPAAGIPWFVAPFGRDSLIVGLQTLHLRPESAAGTLAVLASMQGKEEVPETEEQPGKILHEMRYGEMARTKEIPHRPYYGTVDATPLFAWLVAEVAIWTGEETLWRRFKPHAERALAWIETYGDVDGDGLVEYTTVAQTGAHISHKVWKDSGDSLNYPDGTAVTGWVAAVEVQAYVFAAYDRLAQAAKMFGDADWSVQLRRRAETTRATVEAKFWLEEDGFYAQALDDAKMPVRAISSNPGHLLFAGLPSADRAARVAKKLASAELSGGWGIRTLSSAMQRYNPMSYHNGSVWPHDNSLAVAGMYRYGLTAEAEPIVEALLRAASVDPDRRLPELYCGYPYHGEVRERPVAYPVSCDPQAWASGAFPLILRAMSGLEVDPESRMVRTNPRLAAWIDTIDFLGLRVLGSEQDVRVTRSGGV